MRTLRTARAPACTTNNRPVVPNQQQPLTRRVAHNPDFMKPRFQEIKTKNYHANMWIKKKKTNPSTSLEVAADRSAPAPMPARQTAPITPAAAKPAPPTVEMVPIAAQIYAQYGPAVTLMARGVMHECVKCHGLSPAILSIAETSEHYEITTYQDGQEHNLEYARQILLQVGNPLAKPIKRRFSRFAGYAYLSNGCADPHCDTIFGNFHLGEQLNDQEQQCFAMLVRPTAEWLAVLSRNAW